MQVVATKQDDPGSEHAGIAESPVQQLCSGVLVVKIDITQLVSISSLINSSVFTDSQTRIVKS
jgi:hypothetical protein